MYLQYWKFEIAQDKKTGRFRVRQLFIEKGRFGGGVFPKTIFDAATYEECRKFCVEHQIRLYETRG